MAIARVHTLGNGHNASTATTCVINTVTNTTTIGNHIIVVASWGAADRTSAVTDSQGNTYQQDVTKVGTSMFGRIFSSHTTHALTSGVDTITITFTGGTTNVCSIAAYEYSGIDGTTWFDKGASATATSTAPNSGATATTSNANELIFGLIGFAGTGAVTSSSGTQIENLGVNRNIQTQERFVSATGTYTTSGTIANVEWVALTATYNQASAGATATLPPGFRFGFN